MKLYFLSLSFIILSVLFPLNAASQSSGYDASDLKGNKEGYIALSDNPEVFFGVYPGKKEIVLVKYDSALNKLDTFILDNPLGKLKDIVGATVKNDLIYLYSYDKKWGNHKLDLSVFIIDPVAGTLTRQELPTNNDEAQASFVSINDGKFIGMSIRINILKIYMFDGKDAVFTKELNIADYITPSGSDTTVMALPLIKTTEQIAYTDEAIFIQIEDALIKVPLNAQKAVFYTPTSNCKKCSTTSRFFGNMLITAEKQDGKVSFVTYQLPEMKVIDKLRFTSKLSIEPYDKYTGHTTVKNYSSVLKIFEKGDHEISLQNLGNMGAFINISSYEMRIGNTNPITNVQTSDSRSAEITLAVDKEGNFKKGEPTAEEFEFYNTMKGVAESQHYNSFLLDGKVYLHGKVNGPSGLKDYYKIKRAK
ncbi:hypothetical protein AB9P05_13370 [Roseivirga sp. BDSF3-8]|uniref:hypothetical protein n=1 Tax=Roseivirga sp. BDSF3-8 TaxID=3241598 RepID=UPI003531C6D3